MKNNLREREKTGLSVREATLDDAELLWKWANDPSVREQSFNPKPVEWESHLEWLSRRMASPGTRFYLLLDNGRPVGQIRYDLDESGDSAEIGFSIDKENRGKKFGIEILKLTCDRALRDLGCRRITALVIKGNEASFKAFLRAGFKEEGLTERNGITSHLFVWSSENN